MVKGEGQVRSGAGERGGGRLDRGGKRESLGTHIAAF
jgi:hypothetical protein